jgi:hypothetical protein
MITAGMMFTQTTGRYCVDVGNDYNRVETAFGAILNLRNSNGELRPATSAEIESAIFNWVEQSTHRYEDMQHAASYSPPPFGSAKKYVIPSPTPPKK